ncbi:MULTISPECIES: hypothetical protein [unclassified Streptomyces]|uniref:hypothetical protein n=1 Tax=unclassified Streptomyces TaxID=2593676 RepID=UPI003326520A
MDGAAFGRQPWARGHGAPAETVRAGAPPGSGPYAARTALAGDISEAAISRTVHHVPSRHRTGPAYWPHGLPGPFTFHALTELRYSAAESSLRRTAGRRPVPVPVVRAFTAYTYPRAFDARPQGPYESTARAALRAFRTEARTRLRAAPPDALLRVAEELDLPPTRHRHRNIEEL